MKVSILSDLDLKLAVGFSLITFLATVFVFLAHQGKVHADNARRMVHAMGGAMMMLFVPCPYSLVTFVLASIAVLFVAAFTHYHPVLLRQRAEGRNTVDVGIVLYGMVILAMVGTDVPSFCLAPLFFGDPSASLAGTFAQKQKRKRRPSVSQRPGQLESTPTDRKSKTLEGAIAFFVVSLLSLLLFESQIDAILETTGQDVCRKQELIVLSFTCAISEYIARDYDNIIVGTICIAWWHCR